MNNIIIKQNFKFQNCTILSKFCVYIFECFEQIVIIINSIATAEVEYFLYIPIG